MLVNKEIKTAIFLFVITCFIYFLSSPGETPYDYFTRLSEGFIHFKLYTSESPSWLNELIPVDGKYFVALPPMPAIIMTPFVYIFGEFFSETVFSITLGSINVVLVYLLIKKLNFSQHLAVFMAVFFAFGTNHYFLSSVGSSWYLAHIVALFFLLSALIETCTKKRLILVGLLLGASFWARTSVLFTIPFFHLYLYEKFWPISKEKIVDFIKLSFGVAFFILIDAFYNFLRFGNFSPLAPYNLIQNVDTNTVVNGVYMSISYIPRHIDALFFRVPKLSEQAPYFIPSLYATAIWFTSPLLIYIFKAKKSLLMISCTLAIISALLVVIQWAGVGFSQFGYRFAQDFMPFLLILVAIGLGKKPSKIAYILLILSIIINFWGTITINKFHLYTM